MRSKLSKISGLVLIFNLILTGCGSANSSSQPVQDPGIFYTQAAETMSVAMTFDALAAIQAAPSSTPFPPTELPSPTFEPTNLPTETPTLTIELPTEGPTATPVPETPILHVTENTNCRAGPSPVYGVEGYVTTAMNLAVVGINEGRSWWWVENPTYPGYHCWVWKYTSVVEGDTSMVPVYRDPWTMTPADPDLEVSIKAYPGNYSGTCPQKVTIVASIKSDRAVHIQYEWLRGGSKVLDKGWIVINADGTGTLTTSLNIPDDTKSYVNLRINSPIRMMTKKANFIIDCKK